MPAAAGMTDFQKNHAHDGESGAAITADALTLIRPTHVDAPRGDSPSVFAPPDDECFQHFCRLRGFHTASSAGMTDF